MKIGLKLWSTNDFYLSPARVMHNKRVFDYIELFVVPHSLNYINVWVDTGIPIILHAPHELTGLNFSLKEFRGQNFELIKEIEDYRQAVDPSIVIFHPGIAGDIGESITQISMASAKLPTLFKKAVIENNPKVGLNNEQCIGYDYATLHSIIRETQIGFCLDFGHAIVSAAAEHIPWKQKINQLFTLNPIIHHLSDGKTASVKDKHLHFGEGDFDVAYLLRKINLETSLITLETPKDNKIELNDFEKDVRYLRDLLR